MEKLVNQWASSMLSIDGMCGIKMGGTVINNIRYADNTVIIAESTATTNGHYKEESE